MAHTRSRRSKRRTKEKTDPFFAATDEKLVANGQLGSVIALENLYGEDASDAQALVRRSARRKTIRATSGETGAGTISTNVKPRISAQKSQPPQQTKKGKKNSDFVENPVQSPGSSEAVELSVFPTLALKLHGIAADRVRFYGLVQELVTPDVFGKIVVTILLNQTTGRAAIPVFYKIMWRYPTPRLMSEADLEELTDMLQPIGLHNIRAKRLIDLGRAWCEAPPRLGVYHKSRVQLPRPAGLRRRTQKRNRKTAEEEGTPQRPTYPPTEISHLPGVGRYALDSYLIFKPSLLHPTNASVQNGLLLIQGVTEPKPKSAEWESILDRRVELGEPRDVGSLLPREEEAACGSKPASEDDWRHVDALDKELKAYMLWRMGREGVLKGS